MTLTIGFISGLYMNNWVGETKVSDVSSGLTSYSCWSCCTTELP